VDAISQYLAEHFPAGVAGDAAGLLYERFWSADLSESGDGFFLRHGNAEQVYAP